MTPGQAQGEENQRESSASGGASPSAESAGGLLSLAVRRPVAVLSCVILVVLFGALAIVRLPIQLTPDISTPTVTVATRWPGASPVEVEGEILEEQEEVLKRVEGLEHMESEATLGSAEVTLELSVGTNIEEALVRVTNQLSQVPDYPDSSEQPIVSTARRGGPPLAVIVIYDQQGNSIGRYRTWVEEEIVPELERVEGVASTRVYGGQHSEVHIDFDSRELAARGLTIPGMTRQIRGALRDRSAGDFEVGKRRLLVRVQGAPERAEELSRLVLTTSEEGTPVYLRDVADVEIGLRKREGFAIADDRDAMALLPSREAGTNVLEVTENLRDVVHRLHREKFLPEGLHMKVVSDQTPYIYGALDQVRTNLLFGAVLATVVLLLFLRSFTASFIVALAIPICVLGTALGMTLLGRSVNVVSLAGVTFAVGMVVDNSIVALENIDTWRRRVPDPKEAALQGIREVWGAIVASTATTAAVFIPIIVWEGEVGELLRDIAYAVAISVCLSLVVAVLVIPSLSALLLRSRSAGAARTGNAARSRLAQVVSFASKVRERVANSVNWCTARTWRAAIIFVFSVLGTAAVAIALLPPMEYLPTGNRNLVFGIVLPPPGLSVDELMETGFENQAIMQEHTGPKAAKEPRVERSFFAGGPTTLFIGAVAEDDSRVSELRDFMQELHARIPGVINFAVQAALFSGGIGEGRAVEVVLSGRDLDKILGTARQLFGELREAVPGAKVRPVPVLDAGAPELHLVPKQEETNRLGLTLEEVGLVADASIDGAIIGEFGKEGEPKLDVVVRGEGLSSSGGDPDPGTIGTLPVATPDGRIVPMETLVRTEPAVGPVVIQRIERRRAVSLQVTPPDEMAFEKAVDRVGSLAEKLRAEGRIPEGVNLSLGGSAGKLVVAQKQFAGILLMALVISYLLLSALFEDFVAPLAVLAVLPMAAAGGVLGLSWVNEFLVSQPLDLVTALGFLILIGVVVNNAILIVDGALARLRRGGALNWAVRESVHSRVRPIFMSTLTSLAGLTPLVLSSGPGSELYRGVGTVVLGGLALSTILSLLTVPALFVVLWSLRPSSRVRESP